MKKIHPTRARFYKGAAPKSVALCDLRHDAEVSIGDRLGVRIGRRRKLLRVTGPVFFTECGCGSCDPIAHIPVAVPGNK